MGAYIYKLHKVLDTNIGKVGLLKYWYKPGLGWEPRIPRGHDSTIDRLLEKHDGGVDYFVYAETIKEAMVWDNCVLKRRSGMPVVVVNDCEDIERVGKLCRWRNERNKFCYAVETS
jgi:hypothetical protein